MPPCESGSRFHAVIELNLDSVDILNRLMSATGESFASAIAA